MPLTSTRTPAIDDHVTRRSSPRPWSGTRIRIALAVVLGALGAGVVRAETPSFERAAEAGTAAERVVTSGDGLLFPIDPSPRCEVLDNFGGNSKAFGSGGHQGLDIGAEVGQAVYAVEDGVLYRRLDDLGSAAGLGWGLWSVTDVKYRYYHLDSFADGLEEGDEVERGQIIGYVGDTGNATPGGWHLHFEVRPGPHPRYGSADPVDPMPLLDIPSVCNVY